MQCIYRCWRELATYSWSVAHIPRSLCEDPRAVESLGSHLGTRPAILWISVDLLTTKVMIGVCVCEYYIICNIYNIYIIYIQSTIYIYNSYNLYLIYIQSIEYIISIKYLIYFLIYIYNLLYMVYILSIYNLYIISTYIQSICSICYKYIFSI